MTSDVFKIAVIALLAVMAAKMLLPRVPGLNALAAYL